MYWWWTERINIIVPLRWIEFHIIYTEINHRKCTRIAINRLLEIPRENWSVQYLWIIFDLRYILNKTHLHFLSHKHNQHMDTYTNGYLFSVCYRREDIDKLSAWINIYTFRMSYRPSIHVLYATHANRLSRFWWIHNIWYCFECVRWLDNWVGYSHQAVRPLAVRVHIYLNVSDAWLNIESRLVDYIDTAFYW